MKMETTLVLDPNRVMLNPDNPPGRTRDTTALQATLRAFGYQLKRIIVVPVEDNPDYDYMVIDGNRRTVACRALGWQVMAVLADNATDDEVLDISVTANVTTPLTPMEMAIKLMQMEKAGRPPLQAQMLLGVNEDDARALRSLVKENEAVQDKVRDGSMSISAYKEFKRLPKEDKDKLIESKKPITVAKATKARKTAQRQRAKRMLDDGDNIIAKVKEVDERVTFLLNALPYGEGVAGDIKPVIENVVRKLADIAAYIGI